MQATSYTYYGRMPLPCNVHVYLSPLLLRSIRHPIQQRSGSRAAGFRAMVDATQILESRLPVEVLAPGAPKRFGVGAVGWSGAAQAVGLHRLNCREAYRREPGGGAASRCSGVPTLPICCN
jgi:hypothetical protein